MTAEEKAVEKRKLRATKERLAARQKNEAAAAEAAAPAATNTPRAGVEEPSQAVRRARRITAEDDKDARNLGVTFFAAADPRAWWNAGSRAFPSIVGAAAAAASMHASGTVQSVKRAAETAVAALSPAKTARASGDTDVTHGMRGRAIEMDGLGDDDVEGGAAASVHDAALQPNASRPCLRPLSVSTERENFPR